jgi:hypothetical protein
MSFTMQQYEKAVFNGFGRCYGDLEWAKKQAAQYWRDSGCTGSPPDFFGALLSAKSHVSMKPKEWSAIFIAAQAEAGATFLRTGSFPQWWDDETNEEALRCMHFAKIRAAKLAAKLEADKAELEKVD